MAVKKFNYTSLKSLSIDMDTMNIVSKIHEYKGKQELYIAANPQILSKLTDLAIIQSTDASNKIEGIFTSDARLKDIVQRKAHPKNRNEEEIAGYRDVLSLIHEDFEYIRIVPNDILTLHNKLYAYSPKPFKGKFKNGDNVITETDSTGNEFVRFQPAPAYLTPEYVAALCIEYNKAIQAYNIDPLILIPCFVLDFLSIHPFDDGNGRMSRLLTLLLLYQNGYLVGKYISIEMLIETSKESYYEALGASSVGWLENTNTYLPFLRYSLGIILNAYTQFEDRFQTVRTQALTPSERVLQIMQRSLTPLSRADIMVLAPELSQRTLERVLAALQKTESIEKIGAGRATTYISKNRL